MLPLLATDASLPANELLHVVECVRPGSAAHRAKAFHVTFAGSADIENVRAMATGAGDYRPGKMLGRWRPIGQLLVRLQFGTQLRIDRLQRIDDHARHVEVKF
jgi:hypothetical protein